MIIQEISKYIIPMGLIIAGLYMRFSKEKDKFVFYKRFWFLNIVVAPTHSLACVRGKALALYRAYSAIIQ